MSLNSDHFEICGESFTRIQLLKLAGVHGIHRTFEPFEGIILEVTDIGDGAVLDIYSPKIVALQVVIYPEQKLIRNQLFINYTFKTGAAFNWVDKQTRYIQNKNFDRLELTATREDNFKYINSFTGKECQCPLVGYLIWMKFGYIMTDTEKISFETFLKLHKKSSQTILDLVTTDELFWKNLGYSWNGFFELSNQESQTILKDYRPGLRNQPMLSAISFFSLS